MRKREKETQEESVEYLDVEIVLTGQSEMRLETGIYRELTLITQDKDDRWPEGNSL